MEGRGRAVASLVLGICAIICWFFGAGAIAGVVLGIVGICLANKAKSLGNTEGVRTGGFVCSIIGLVGSGLAVIIYIMAFGTLALIFS